MYIFLIIDFKDSLVFNLINLNLLITIDKRFY